MNIELWLAYVSAVLVLMVAPGPSQLLMLSNSIENGFRRSIATALGDLSANVVQITVASMGLVAAVGASGEFFRLVKWAGVVYLIYVGVLRLFAKVALEETGERYARSLRSLYWQGFITSAANPKAVVFFAALFPQFVDTSKPTGAQFLLLGATYVVIDGAFLWAYGRFADWAGRILEGPSAAFANRVSGALIILAALLLGLKGVEAH